MPAPLNPTDLVGLRLQHFHSLPYRPNTPAPQHYGREAHTGCTPCHQPPQRTWWQRGIDSIIMAAMLPMMFPAMLAMLLMQPLYNLFNSLLPKDAYGLSPLDRLTNGFNQWVGQAINRMRRSNPWLGNLVSGLRHANEWFGQRLANPKHIKGHPPINGAASSQASTAALQQAGLTRMDATHYRTKQGAIIELNSATHTKLPGGIGLQALANLADRLQAKGLKTLYITGGAEQHGHSHGSRHYRGLAVDIGTQKNGCAQNLIPGCNRTQSNAIIKQECQALLKAGQPGFDFALWEGDHLHLSIKYK